MANRVFMNDEGIEEMVLDGDQHIDEFKKTMEESIALDKQLAAAGRPLKSIIDISKMGELDRQVIYEALFNILRRPYERSAVYGNYETANPIVKTLLKDIDHISANKFKVFKTRKEALDWVTDHEVFLP